MVTYRHDHSIVDYMFEKITANIDVCKCPFMNETICVLNIHIYIYILVGKEFFSVLFFSFNRNALTIQSFSDCC